MSRPMFAWTVPEKQSGLSLQGFIKAHMGEGVSAKKVKRAVDAGKCTLNGRTERFSTRLVGTGDKIAIEIIEVETKEVKGESADRILYADEDLIALNKAPGELSDGKAIADALTKKYGKVILLHRLDKETSGVLLFARNVSAANAIEELFKQRKVSKTYYAIVDGTPAKASGVIENALGKLKVYQGQTLWGEVSDGTGLKAKTRWQIKTVGKEASLIVCHPETGRTHQIRVHLSGMGHPILGDYQYGKRFAASYKAPRILLHAAEVAFDHPNTGKKIAIIALFPQDFTEALKRL